MPHPLDNDLDNVQRLILCLAGLVEATLHKAIQALIHRDIPLAREVISTEGQIDEEETHVNEECLNILSQNNPDETSLRKIAATMMIVVDLERMGDLAEEIAESAIEVAKEVSVPVPLDIANVAELTRAMVRESLDAFVKTDVKLARRVHGKDQQVDELTEVILTELRERMKESPEYVNPALSLYDAVQRLERIADHATNIAESALYLAQGEIVRHRPGALYRDDDDDDD